MKNISRRKMLQLSGNTLAASVFGLPLTHLRSGSSIRKDQSLKVIVAGAHPDDPETGCGGTMALLAAAGHQVISFYLTRGEAGIPGKTHDEAAKIRTAEAENACKILHAEPKFAGQIDGASVVTNEWYDKIWNMIETEKPDLVFTHWPIDQHRDHRATSIMIFDVWLRSNASFTLYYFEVLTGEQTRHFRPTHYVDITSVENQKRLACYAHKSQDPDDMYAYHKKMSEYRGMESRTTYAEAYFLQDLPMSVSS